MPSLVREGEIFAGKYRVERILGEGGHGLVFAARNIELDERVAIKLLKRASADGTTAERFLREARAAQKIRGDGVARVFAVDQLDDGDLFMVMEYLEGRDLRQELRTSGKLEISDAVECILQTCDVLGRAHAMGIIHRDIKSANLFSVKRNDGRRQIKLLDFGIARSLDLVEASLTQSPQMMGSPLYMAPEQIVDGRSVDQRSDIWGLGATLFELLAGMPPFGGGSILQVLLRVQEHPPDDLQLLRPGVPADLERIVIRCLEKDRSKRFPDVGSLAAALGPFRVASGSPASSARDASPESIEESTLNIAGPSQRPSGPAPPPWSPSPATPGFSGGEILAATVLSAGEAPRVISRPSFPPPYPQELPQAAASQAPSRSTPLLLAMMVAGLTLLFVIAFVALSRRGAAVADATAVPAVAASPAVVPVPVPMPTSPITSPRLVPPAIVATARSPESAPESEPTAAPRGGHHSRVGSSGKAGRPGATNAPGPAPMPDDRQ